MAIYYVDLSASTNGTGTELSPFNSFTSVNAGLWDGNEIRVKRGSSLIVNAGTRANIDAASGCLLTSYGDAAAPLPVISGGGAGFNPVWLRNGAGIIVEQVHVTSAPGSGIVVSPIAGSTLSNITVRDVLVTNNTTNNTLWGTDGVQVGGFTQADSGTVTNVLLQRITARDNGGHGFKVRGRASNVRVIDSVSLRSGLRTPAHALGTAGHFAELNNTSVGAKDIRTGWTNISGNIWEHALSETGAVTSISSWFAAYIIGAGPTYYKLPYSATPATPGPGECGIGANNTIRINLNGVVAPTALVSLYGIFARPENVKFERCVGAYTADVNPTGTPIEGQGIYFDNGSFKCFSYDCLSFNNEGHGLYLNDATECGHYRMTVFNNGKGAGGITRGDGTNVFGCTLIARKGTNGLIYTTGNARAKARQNEIINASVGIWTNDLSTNSVAENNNLFVNCTTRLTAVSSPGASSLDRTAVPSEVNIMAARLRNAAAAAELIN